MHKRGATHTAPPMGCGAASIAIAAMQPESLKRHKPFSDGSGHGQETRKKKAGGEPARL